MNRIFVDYDATVVDLIAPWLAWLETEFDLHLTSRDIPVYAYVEKVYGPEISRFLWAKGTYDQVNPLLGATAFFNDLQNMFGEDNVFFLSASYDSHKEEKETHARKHFGVRKSQFLHANNKQFFTNNAILIGDHPRHVVRHAVRNQSLGIIYTGNDQYAWSNMDNYDDAEISSARKDRVGGLVETCPDYHRILKVLKFRAKGEGTCHM